LRNEQIFALRKERPHLLHVAVGLVLVAFFGYFLLRYLQMFTSETIMQTLSLAGITYDKTWTTEEPAILMKLVDATDFRMVMTWQRSGFLSMAIFSLLFVLLAFPLSGPLWCKIAWLGLGNVVGLVWNFVRLFLSVMAAYYLGEGAFKVVDFVTGPTIDFLWVVPVWSLGLSLLACAERRKRTRRIGKC